MTPVLEKYGEGSVDSTILADCAEEGIAVVTNDRDFVRLAAERDHAGIVVYTDRTLLLDEPVEAAEALGKIDRHYAPDSMRNTVEWLDGWV